MVPNTVQFTNFTVEEPLHVLKAQDQNKPCFWPDEWTIILEPKGKGDGISTDVNLYAWFRNNCAHQFDISWDVNGSRVFAFECDEEATLFMLSF